MTKSITRCTWAANSTPIMQAYHDEEWGVPIYDSRELWQHLMLDGFQAGLAWSIILNKREAFLKAFKNFDPEKVARFKEADIPACSKTPASSAPAPRSKPPSAEPAPTSTCSKPAKTSPSSSGTWPAASPSSSKAPSPPKPHSPKTSPKPSKNAASNS